MNQYTGRENDGSGLYYYRSRYYEPTLGRFISQDPMGFLGGINGYSYAQDDPVNLIDPMGLASSFSMADYQEHFLNADEAGLAQDIAARDQDAWNLDPNNPKVFPPLKGRKLKFHSGSHCWSNALFSKDGAALALDALGYIPGEKAGEILLKILAAGGAQVIAAYSGEMGPVYAGYVPLTEPIATSLAKDYGTDAAQVIPVIGLGFTSYLVINDENKIESEVVDCMETPISQ